jgi:hypothetical protein
MRKQFAKPVRTGFIGAGFTLVSWAIDRLWPNLPNAVPLALLFIGVVMIATSVIRALLEKGEDDLLIAKRIYLDCDPVGHHLGGPALHLYSAAFCIEVENASETTIRGLKAIIRDSWRDDTGPLLIRDRHERIVDLNPHERVRIEVGRMTMQMEPGHTPGMERHEGYWVLSDGEINGAYNQEKSMEVFQPSAANAAGLGHMAGQEMAPFDVLVTAEDTPAQIVRLQGDLWHVQAVERMKIVSIKRSR